MAGLTNAEAQATLDARFPTTGGTDHVGFSVNGSSEFAGLARMPVGATGWAAATNADPSVKANSGTLTTAAASGAGVVSHYAIFTQLTGGTQRTDWTALSSSRTFGVGDTGSFAAAALAVTLT